MPAKTISYFSNPCLAARVFERLVIQLVHPSHPVVDDVMSDDELFSHIAKELLQERLGLEATSHRITQLAHLLLSFMQKENTSC